MGHVVRLCHRSELAEGSARGFDPHSHGRDILFVVRRSGIHAYRNDCPHWEGTSLPWRKDAYRDPEAYAKIWMETETSVKPLLESLAAKK